MKIVIAPDSFKECLAAADVAAALAEGLRRVLPGADLVCVPVADGGEGTLDALVAATAGERLEVEVCGALGEPLCAGLGLLGGGEVAVIEVAQAAGLAQVPAARRDPMHTTSYGIGQLVVAALERGVRRFIVGLGGTATVDGGAGLLQALGARMLDTRGLGLPRPLRGRDVMRVAAVDLSRFDRRVAEADFQVACDVDNPLCGPLGAAAVFGPQKGATMTQVAQLDAALASFHDVLVRAGGRSVQALPGAGAAGGLGAALLACFPCTLRPGIGMVMDAVDLRRHLAGAAFVVTGEGRVDAQTLRGKAPAGVARLAREVGVPVVVVGGSVVTDPEVLTTPLFDALEASVTMPCALDQAIAEARPLLIAAGVRIGRWLQLVCTPR